MNNTQTNLYYTELLVSAGPRKEDYGNNPTLRELGEDAGGILSLPNKTYFWISDGTSQEFALYGFSSRKFAQDLGTAFQEQALSHYVNGLSFPDFIQQTFDTVETNWQKRLAERWEIVKSNQDEESFIELLALCGDGHRRQAWSSTFLCGVLEHTEKKLYLYNSGDSGGFVFSEKNELIAIKPNRQRNFIAIDWIPNRHAPICNLIGRNYKNIESYFEQIQEIANAENALFLTDGNIDFDKLIKLIDGKEYLSIVNFLTKLRLNNHDDKSLLCISQLSLSGIQQQNNQKNQMNLCSNNNEEHNECSSDI